MCVLVYVATVNVSILGWRVFNPRRVPDTLLDSSRVRARLLTRADYYVVSSSQESGVASGAEQGTQPSAVFHICVYIFSHILFYADECFNSN